MTTDAGTPGDTATSALGARMETFLHHLRTGGSELSDEALAAAWWTDNPRIAIFRANLDAWRRRMGAFSIRSYEWRPPRVGSAFAEGHDGRRWRCQLVIAEAPPHVILGSSVFAAPAGVTIRQARGSDAKALRAIEARTPLVVGDDRIYFDRGADYFAGERLMGDVDMLVVERDGEVVGLSSAAFPTVRIAGVVHRSSYEHRLRLLPEAQGEGVTGPLGARQMERSIVERAGYINYAFVACSNDAALRKVDPQRRWAAGPSRLLLDTQDNAGSAHGRPATPSDGGFLVKLFNETHSNEELFLPYTNASLPARLELEPAAYSWTNILVGERAAVGIWPARLGVRRESGGVITEDVRALVLDYGCGEGAEDELVALIRSACADLAREGMTEVSLFGAPSSSCYAALSPLAKRIEPYIVSCWIKPGAELDKRGVYVDQLYF